MIFQQDIQILNYNLIFSFKFAENYLSTRQIQVIVIN